MGSSYSNSKSNTTYCNMKFIGIFCLLGNLKTQAQQIISGTSYLLANDIIHGISLGEHGCHCPKLDSARSYPGTAIDEIDQLCKDWLKARHCVTKLSVCDGVSLTYERTGTSIITGYECQTDQSDCQKYLCETDAHYLAAINGLPNSTRFGNLTLTDSFDADTDCVVAGGSRARASGNTCDTSLSFLDITPIEPDWQRYSCFIDSNVEINNAYFWTNTDNDDDSSSEYTGLSAHSIWYTMDDDFDEYARADKWYDIITDQSVVRTGDYIRSPRIQFKSNATFTDLFIYIPPVKVDDDDHWEESFQENMYQLRLHASHQDNYNELMSRFGRSHLWCSSQFLGLDVARMRSAKQPLHFECYDDNFNNVLPADDNWTLTIGRLVEHNNFAPLDGAYYPISEIKIGSQPCTAP